MTLTRKATIGDLGSLSELFDQYRLFYGKTSDIPGAQQFLKARLEKQQSEIYVAEDNTQLLGFTQLYPIFSSTRMKNYWLLNDLFVHKDFRKKGVAKALLSEAKNLCKITDACGILLETDKTNEAGNALYPSEDFKPYTHANFYEWLNPEA